MSEKICILLCTLNGERFLQKQLDSIASQTHTNWLVVISDDGSTDQTKVIIKNFQDEMGASRVIYIDGPQKGYAANFLHSLRHAKNKSKYWAFCDHDDIWKNTKLEYALNAITKYQEQDRPIVCCSSTDLINEKDKFLRKSPIRRGPNFCHSLVENIAGGNTMLFNQAAKKLILSIPCEMRVVSHDWILYQLVIGVGGIVNYDLTPSVFYRLHRGNTVGSKISVIGKYERLKSFFRGELRSGINDNLRILSYFRAQLTEENKAKLELFQEMRSSAFKRRASILFDKNFLRSSFSENVILKLGNIFKLV